MSRNSTVLACMNFSDVLFPRGELNNLYMNWSKFCFSLIASTTMVGGLAAGDHKLDITTASLPELSDISAIKLDGNNSGNKAGGDETLCEDTSVRFALYFFIIFKDVSFKLRDVLLGKIIQ